MRGIGGIPGKWGMALGALTIAGLTYCTAKQNDRAAADLRPPSASTQGLAATLPSSFLQMAALDCMERVAAEELVCRLGGQREEARAFWQRTFEEAGWTRVAEQGPVSVLERGPTRIRMAFQPRSRELVFSAYRATTP